MNAQPQPAAPPPDLTTADYTDKDALYPGLAELGADLSAVFAHDDPGPARAAWPSATVPPVDEKFAVTMARQAVAAYDACGAFMDPETAALHLGSLAAAVRLLLSSGAR